MRNTKLDHLGSQEANAGNGVKLDREMPDFLAGVVGVVEADTYAQHMLWSENRSRDQPKLWKEHMSGLMECVGQLAKMPVCISLLKAEVDGHLLLFFYATSQVVDHRMVRKWLEDNLPATAWQRDRLNITDAMNFHSVFRAPLSDGHSEAKVSPVATTPYDLNPTPPIEDPRG